MSSRDLFRGFSILPQSGGESDPLGWTADELAAAPVIGRLHQRILDLEDQLFQIQAAAEEQS